jgi:hypothetical protein
MNQQYKYFVSIVIKDVIKYKNDILTLNRVEKIIFTPNADKQMQRKNDIFILILVRRMIP